MGRMGRMGPMGPMGGNRQVEFPPSHDLDCKQRDVIAQHVRFHP